MVMFVGTIMLPIRILDALRDTTGKLTDNPILYVAALIF
jgi:hypothetical protein